MTETLRWCASCAAETFFESVLVEDGAFDGEMGCVDCGDAIVVGLALPGAPAGAVPLAA